MKYTTAAAIIQKTQAENKQRFKELLAKSKGDAYQYDPSTNTHKLKDSK